MSWYVIAIHRNATAVSANPQALAAWQDELAHSQRIEKEADSLDMVAYQQRWDTDVSLRLVMLHMIHEYARHNGHADLLREAIDGAVGA